MRTNARQPFERTGFGCPFLRIEHWKVQTKPLSSIAWNSTACPPLKDGRDLRYFVGTDSALLVSVLRRILEKVVILGQAKRRYNGSSSKNGFKLLLLVIFPLDRCFLIYSCCATAHTVKTSSKIRWLHDVTFCPLPFPSLLFVGGMRETHLRFWSSTIKINYFFLFFLWVSVLIINYKNKQDFSTVLN